MYVKNNFFLNIFRQLTSKYKSSDFNRLNVFQRGGYKKILSVRHGFISVVGKKKCISFERGVFLFFLFFAKLDHWIIIKFVSL